MAARVHGCALGALPVALPLVLGLLGAPAIEARSVGTPGSCPECRETAILSINDVYRFAGVDDGSAGGLARVRSLRRELETLYPDPLMLHAGDLLAPSLISRTCKGELMVRALDLLDGAPGALDERMWVVFGNHEFDDPECSTLRRRLSESELTWLDTNVRFAPCVDAEELRRRGRLARRTIVESGGIRIGIFGLTIPSKTQDYIEGYDDPLETALDESKALRRDGAEVVVALTHLELDTDCRILEDLAEAGPDLIVGGHDHERTRWCGGRGLPVFKADADARTASVIVLRVDGDGQVEIRQEFRELDARTRRPDPMVESEAETLVRLHDELFCAADIGVENLEGEGCFERHRALEERLATGDVPGYEPRCLDERLSHTETELVGEETAIRRRETSLGNWVADLMRGAYEECGAEVAFVNSGSLRLNQTLPAGATIRRRHLEELVQYDGSVHLIEIDGATLHQVVERSVAKWPGSGHWLQVSGMAFLHDTGGGAVTGLTLLDGPEAVAIDGGGRVRAAVPRFLLDPELGDQDGYRMLSLDQVVEGCDREVPSLAALLEAELERRARTGIAPRSEGRICQGGAGPDCLAQPPRKADPISPCSIIWLILGAVFILWPIRSGINRSAPPSPGSG